ncbi:MAG: hypothetical protein C4523_20240 [Myxococcales bacterium]|nr:MAG: hypothetical protein C4523_20240 [Myxococcales bacterium]
MPAARIVNQAHTLAPEEELRDVEPVFTSRLCVNCAHVEGCGYSATASTAFVECELYECSPEPAAASPARQDCAVRPDADLAGLHLLGLCANCDSRRRCKLPKPPSGVWHCEEYC